MPVFDLFEAMNSQRAIRHFKPEPVPPELIHEVLSAAVRAPSASNRQAWRFIVVTDPETKRGVGAIYREAQLRRDTRNAQTGLDRTPSTGQLATSASDLREHMGDVPVIILACIPRDDSPANVVRWASIFPAVQNLMLAARGLGLGTVITTGHHHMEDELRDLLGIPEDVDTAALIPMGFPADDEHFGGSRRKPVEEVAFQDRWDNPWNPAA